VGLGVTAVAQPLATRARSRRLDQLRGLAVVCMVVDHVCLYAGGPAELRWTVGRVAAPVFFVLAGHLATRVTARHFWLFPLALFVVPEPVAYDGLLIAVCACSLLTVLARRTSVAGCLLGALVLDVAVPGVASLNGTYLLPSTLVCFLVGALLERRHLERLAAGLPPWLAQVGRYPLSLYVGHLLLLDALRGAVT
jgi:uncharacterized membrane protein